MAQAHNAKHEDAVPLSSPAGEQAIGRSDDEADATLELDRQASRLFAQMTSRMEVFVGLDHLFGDPAWSILLYLYRMFSLQRPSTLTDVSAASGAPASTAVRYLERLERAGLILREPDWRNRRRYHLSLSPRGRQLMNRYLANVAGAA